MDLVQNTNLKTEIESESAFGLSKQKRLTRRPASMRLIIKKSIYFAEGA